MGTDTTDAPRTAAAVGVSERIFDPSSTARIKLRWDAHTRQLASPRRAIRLPRAQAIIFDELWRADGSPVPGPKLTAVLGVKAIRWLPELSNKLTPFGLHIASRHSGGYWLASVEADRP